MCDKAYNCGLGSVMVCRPSRGKDSDPARDRVRRRASCLYRFTVTLLPWFTEIYGLFYGGLTRDYCGRWRDYGKYVRQKAQCSTT